MASILHRYQDQKSNVEWLTHIAEYTGCRDPFANYHVTWRVLGQWQASAGADQPDDAWLQELHRRLEQRQSFVHKLMPVSMRAAAVILVAAGLGVDIGDHESQTYCLWPVVVNSINTLLILEKFELPRTCRPFFRKNNMQVVCK